MSKAVKQIAFVTGAGRGIGAATAKLFAAKGYRVALLSRSEKELTAVKNEIVKAGTPEKDVLILSVDLSNRKEIASAFAKISSELGPVSVLVNNAATIVVKPFIEFSSEEMDRVLDVNLKAVFLCCQEAFKQMKTSGGGSIVNVSSLGGVQGTEKFPGFSAYTASKAGVVGLTEALAVEGRPLGIRVNCIAPGAVDTKMLKEAAPFLKTSTKPEDIAKIIAGFCDVGSAATGEVLAIHSNE